ncbi:SRPBCC family protein [Flavobacterium artemisiae]|uniref:SRPBCC family protein n=1 Tax=Flavobacterium artemisiae TaxID=2126556 RepID=A0ABW4HA47_9FLAO
MATNISTILLNAPTEKVWNALTQPELVKQWQYGSDLITDWKVNSEIRFRNEWEGQVFEQWGKILEVIPNQKIRYSLFFPRPGLEDKPENYFIMSYVLSEENQKTKLEIIQEDNRPEAKQEEPQGEENPILQALKAVVESLN